MDLVITFQPFAPRCASSRSIREIYIGDPLDCLSRPSRARTQSNTYIPYGNPPRRRCSPGSFPFCPMPLHHSKLSSSLLQQHLVYITLFLLLNHICQRLPDIHACWPLTLCTTPHATTISGSFLLFFINERLPYRWVYTTEVPEVPA